MRARTLYSTLALGAALVALASAGMTSSAAAYTVKVGQDYGLSRAIVVSGLGKAVYRRSGETRTHLLCTGVCLQKWIPLTVRSSTTPLTKGPGIRGLLSKFRRSDNGKYQVTLRGAPLYTYSPDHSPGDARGQGEGNVWWTLAP
ncbi:MAG: hypothetical protein LC713_07225 [Actinobacteria bacterium]|nr:hypothetical protein [Actinomycetota bacterium]